VKAGAFLNENTIQATPDRTVIKEFGSHPGRALPACQAMTRQITHHVMQEERM
jgi:hypothetical protein